MRSTVPPSISFEKVDLVIALGIALGITGEPDSPGVIPRGE